MVVVVIVVAAAAELQSSTQNFLHIVTFWWNITSSVRIYYFLWTVSGLFYFCCFYSFESYYLSIYFEIVGRD